MHRTATPTTQRQRQTWSTATFAASVALTMLVGCSSTPPTDLAASSTNPATSNAMAQELGRVLPDLARTVASANTAGGAMIVGIGRIDNRTGASRESFEQFRGQLRKVMIAVGGRHGITFDPSPDYGSTLRPIVHSSVVLAPQADPPSWLLRMQLIGPNASEQRATLWEATALTPSQGRPATTP